MNVSDSFNFLCSSVFSRKVVEFLRESIPAFRLLSTLKSHYETEQCSGNIVFTGSVAEVRDNKQFSEQFLEVWEFDYLLKERHE